MQLEAEKLAVPAGILGQLVVGLTQVGEVYGRQFGKAQEFRRVDPAVAGDDGVVGIDEDGIGEAEMRDRGSELLDLLGRVRARIGRAGFERADRPIGDFEVGHGLAPHFIRSRRQMEKGAAPEISENHAFTMECDGPSQAGPGTMPKASARQRGGTTTMLPRRSPI